MNFIKSIFSNLIALALFSLIVLFIFISVISVLSAGEKVVVESHSVLHLKLDKPITEQAFENPLEELGSFGGPGSSIGLMELKETIKNAAGDEKIDGILLDLKYFLGGMAGLQELRGELASFRDSGKFVYAYSEYYTEGAYYLASVANKVILNPEGELELNGLSANVTFLKGTLDKFGIEAQIFRVGEYKSAVETFMRKDLSQENELQLTELLAGLNSKMVDDIAGSRELDVEKVSGTSEQMLVRNAKDALTFGLADHLMYKDELLSLIEDTAGEDYNLVEYKKYRKSFSNYKEADGKVAVIVAAGDIVTGKGDERNIGSEKFAKLIKEAREDDDIDAIVIRINSPGGSYLASDIMWREIKLASEAKPVIASMSDYAASGGYYMAMACDTIVAQPNTITGSIGIFGILFNFEGLLEDRLGVTHDEVKTGEFSGMLTATRPLTAAEKSIIQKSVEEKYNTFISKAAAGREMTEEKLRAVASGRVWTGAQAEANGLVDILGSFDDALDIAAQKAGLGDNYKVTFFPEPKTFVEQIVDELNTSARAILTEREMGVFYPYAEKIRKLKDLQGIQARLPYDLQLN